MSAGLVNIGNTCYINSVLQCLFNLQSFRHHFTNTDYENSLRINQGRKLVNVIKTFNKQSLLTTMDIIVSNSLTTFLSKLFIEMEREETISPSLFINKFKSLHTEFNNFDQGDSHEFLTILFDSIIEEMGSDIKSSTKHELYETYLKSNPIEAFDILSKNHKIILHEKLTDHIVSNLTYTIPTGLFICMDLINITCLTCRRVNHSFDVFNTLQLSPKPFNEAYEEYYSRHDIENYICPCCETKGCAQIKHSPWSSSKYLCVQFKLFKSNGSKIITDIDIPDEFEHRYQNTIIKYALNSIITHTGTKDYGHYMSYTLNESTNKWTRHDDNSTTNNVIPDKRRAYICMFKQRSMRAFKE